MENEKLLKKIYWLIAYLGVSFGIGILIIIGELSWIQGFIRGYFHVR